MIPYGRHYIDRSDIEAVVDVLNSDWLTTGPIVSKFEASLALKLKSKYAVSCSNGTTALHLAMLALNLGPGDFVLVPTITFLASANAVRYVGADVIFVDVDPNTGLMTAETLENAIKFNLSKNLKALVNVHLAGQCEDLKAIYQVARKYNLKIIEDAAHALGTNYMDENDIKHTIGSNSFSDITTFSFHPVKTITAGEGGAITTNDATLAERAMLLRSHGMIRDPKKWQETRNTGVWYYEMQELGCNYRLSDIGAALTLSQLKKLDNFKKQRAFLVSDYDNLFAENPFINPLRKLSFSETSWHLYVVFIDFKKKGENRADLINRLKSHGIGTQVHYIPLHTQPYYKRLYGEQELSGALEYYSKCLSLPLYVGLTDQQQVQITESLLNVN